MAASPAGRKRAAILAEVAEATEDVKGAYDALAPVAEDLAEFFAAFAAAAMRVLLAHLKPTITFAGQFAAIRAGGKVEPPTADEAQAVIDVTGELVAELVRHARHVLAIRGQSMAVFGMTDPEAVAAALLQDIRRGGRTGGQLRSSVSLAVGAGVNQFAQLTKHVAVARGG